MLSNSSRSIWAAPLIGLLLYWALSNDANRLQLMAWCVAVSLLRLPSVLDARRRLAQAFSLPQARDAIRLRVGLNALQGCAWGCLPWITLDTATPAGKLLVMACLASMVAGTMSLNAAAPAAHLAYGMPVLVLSTTKLLSLDDPAYRFLGLAGLVYLGTLLIQARSVSRAAREAIELRFENLELIKQLRIESEKAMAARLEAERANAAKTRFLAAASHDLRQPLHAQGLFLEVLATSELTALQREVFENLRETSRATAEMLDTLLDYSRIEAGVVKPSLKSFRLQPLLHQIERELAPQADAHGLIYRSRETQLAVRSDPALLKLILRNIVSNAIRYTERGGLLVGCRRRAESVCIEVWDTGIGIAPRDQPDVFREFHQLGNPERDRRKGLGLGLAISQGLARTLGHTLSLASKPGRGSMFRLMLPLVESRVVGEAFQAESAHLPRMAARILILDDDDIVRKGMVQLLSGWGCECRAADSIEQALALVQHHAPDLLITDYRLREQRTGAQAIAELRSSLVRPLPAILITGDTDPERLRDAQACGVPLLHKPVPPDLLYQCMQSALSRSASP
jgi:signal transduction histidine kinase